MANEKRLISVEDTVRQLQHEIYWNDSTKAAIRAFLRTVPAVDAVEVVRCKDCKKWKCHGQPFDITRGTCYNPKFHLHHGHVLEECFMPVTNETDFCSYGERKDNDL